MVINTDKTPYGVPHSLSGDKVKAIKLERNGKVCVTFAAPDLATQFVTEYTHKA